MARRWVGGACVVSGLIAWTALSATRPTSQPATMPATRSATAPVDRVSRLVAQLGDKDFRVREQAGRDLERMGEKALPALREAKRGGDPEVAMRAERIVARVAKAQEHDDE